MEDGDAEDGGDAGGVLCSEGSAFKEGANEEGSEDEEEKRGGDGEAADHEDGAFELVAEAGPVLAGDGVGEVGEEDFASGHGGEGEEDADEFVRVAEDGDGTGGEASGGHGLIDDRGAGVDHAGEEVGEGVFSGLDEFWLPNGEEAGAPAGFGGQGAKHGVAEDQELEEAAPEGAENEIFDGCACEHGHQNGDGNDHGGSGRQGEGFV